MRYSRNLFLVMLAVLAGGSAMPDVGAGVGVGAPSGVSAATASLVAGGQPGASEHARHAGATTGTEEARQAQDDGAGGELSAVTEVVLFTGGPVQHNLPSLRQGHAGGGSSGVGLLSGGLPHGHDPTVSTPGRAPLSTARCVVCRAHGIRAGPLV